MFRKKPAKKEPPKAEHHNEANAQLIDALSRVDQAVKEHMDKLHERNKATRDELVSIQKICKDS